MSKLVFNRRRLFELCSAVSAWLMVQTSQTPSKAQTLNPAHSKTKLRKPYIAIQVPPFCWKDEGVDKYWTSCRKRAK